MCLCLPILDVQNPRALMAGPAPALASAGTASSTASITLNSYRHCSFCCQLDTVGGDCDQV